MRNGFGVVDGMVQHSAVEFCVCDRTVQGWVGTSDLYLVVRFSIGRMIQGNWIIHYCLPIFKRQLPIKVKLEGPLTRIEGVPAFPSQATASLLGLLASFFVFNSPLRFLHLSLTAFNQLVNWTSALQLLPLLLMKNALRNLQEHLSRICCFVWLQILLEWQAAQQQKLSPDNRRAI